MRAGSLLSDVASPLLARAGRCHAARGCARVRALLAGMAALTGATMLVALHLLPASRGLDPLSQPLSEYAFTPDGRLFNIAVLTLACALVVLVSALVRGRCLAPRSPARALLTACSLSLVVVALFPDHAPNGAVSTVGRIHWVAAMLAFGGLSCAPAVLGHHPASRCSRLTALARWLSVLTAPCFMLALAASLVRYETSLPVPAWSFGITERVLVALELALAGVLTAWAWRGCTCRLDDLLAHDSEPAPSPHHSVGRADQQTVVAPVAKLPVLAGADDETEPAARLVA